MDKTLLVCSNVNEVKVSSQSPPRLVNGTLICGHKLPLTLHKESASHHETVAETKMEELLLIPLPLSEKQNEAQVPMIR